VVTLSETGYDDLSNLSHPGSVGVRHGLDPRGAGSDDLAQGNRLPVGLEDHLFEVDGQLLGRAQYADIVEVRGLQGILYKTFALIEEVLYDELMVPGVPPDEKG